jgi:arylsulfatase A-like enzyme
MKCFFKLSLLSLLLATACTTYQEFDKEKAFVFNISDSSQVVIGRQSWKGPEDCSATAYMNKSETGLLLTIQVKDDSVRTGNEFSYMNDGVEIYMDLRPPRLRKINSYEKGVFQAVIIPLPGKKNVAPIEWYPKNYASEVTGASAWTQLFDSGYVVQVFFPYSNLKRNHFWPRTYFSMDIAINDADSVNRETQMMWRGKSDNWQSPVNFQPITVMDNKAESQRARKKKPVNPNILFILTDQQTLTAMGAYGNPFVHTPNMDALAEAGIRFTQSYCSSPGCSPSRSSLITGMYPHETRVNYNSQKPDSSILNMGNIFRKAGYKTIWGGKWELPEAFPHTLPVDSVPGFVLVNFSSPEKTTGKGSDTDTPLADAMTKQLQRRPNEPWLMVISFQNPHDITFVPAQPNSYLPAVNPESTPPLPANFEIDPSEPQFLKDCRNRTGYENELFMASKFNTAEWRNYIFQYYRMVENVDFEIGKIISMLEKQAYDENTLIVFTSDHGDGIAAHRWAGKLSPYEEAMKVPLVISWFGKAFQTNTDERHLVSGIDILPTMLDYAGLTIPSSIEGKSLKPIIENPDAPFREFIFSEIAPDPAQPGRLARMVRYRNYKYVLYSYGTVNEQLFDLKNDPGEKENLSGNPKFVEMKDFLRTNLTFQMMEKKEYFKMADQ